MPQNSGQFEVVGDEPPHHSFTNHLVLVFVSLGVQVWEDSSGDADEDEVSSSDSSTSVEDTDEEDCRGVA